MSKDSFKRSWFKGSLSDIQSSVWHAQFTSSENFMGPPGERRQWQMGRRALWLWEAIKIEKIRIEWEFPFRSFIPPRLNGNNDWFWKGSLHFWWRIGSFLWWMEWNGNFHSILTFRFWRLPWRWAGHTPPSAWPGGETSTSRAAAGQLSETGNTEEFWSHNSQDLIVNWSGTQNLSH